MQPLGGGEAVGSKPMSSMVRSEPGCGQPLGTDLKMKALFWTMVVALEEILGGLARRVGLGLAGAAEWKAGMLIYMKFLPTMNHLRTLEKYVVDQIKK